MDFSIFSENICEKTLHDINSMFSSVTSQFDWLCDDVPCDINVPLAECRHFSTTTIVTQHHSLNKLFINSMFSVQILTIIKQEIIA